MDGKSDDDCPLVVTAALHRGLSIQDRSGRAWALTNEQAPIERGIITPSTKQRLEELEVERANLQASQGEAPLPALHPNLARLYRDKVARLEEELDDPEIAGVTLIVLINERRADFASAQLLLLGRFGISERDVRRLACLLVRHKLEALLAPRLMARPQPP
jgi:hypothetical protein